MFRFAQHDTGMMRPCLDANVKLVTTQLDHELILTEVIVKLLGSEKL